MKRGMGAAAAAANAEQLEAENERLRQMLRDFELGARRPPVVEAEIRAAQASGEAQRQRLERELERAKTLQRLGTVRDQLRAELQAEGLAPGREERVRPVDPVMSEAAAPEAGYQQALRALRQQMTLAQQDLAKTKHRPRAVLTELQ